MPSTARLLASVFAVLLFSGAVLLPAQAQAPDTQERGAVNGIVRDADSGAPLPGVSVRLEGTTLGDATNESGRFQIARVPAGTYTLRASFVGYQTLEREVTVEAGATTDISLEMRVRAIALEGLAVTAQKRAESVASVPTAVASYDGAFLEDIGVQQFDEFSAYVPGLKVQIQSPNNPGFVVRGITSDDGDSRVQPRVSVYKDGVSISKSRGSVVELFDIERVEVLKGPQGTLFGRAAQIGAVHIIQNKAQPQFDAEATVGLGTFAQRKAEAMVNVPVVEDRFFARVAGIYNSFSGQVENLAGNDLNGKETFAVRGAFRWLPTDNTVVDIIGNYQRDTPPGTSFKSGAFGPNGPCSTPREGGCDPTRPAAMGPDPVLEDDALFLERDVGGVTVLVDQSLAPRWTLESISAWRRFDSLERFDADGTVSPALQFDEDAEGSQLSQELRVTYDGDQRLSGFGGVNAFYEDGSQRVPFRTNEQALLAVLNPEVPILQPNGDPTLIPALPTESGPIPLKEEHQESYTNFGETLALEAFIDGTYEILPTLSVTAGLRGTFEDITGAYQVTDPETPGRLGALTGSGQNDLFATTNGARLSRSETFLSAVGRLAARYEPTPAANIFASVSRGRRPNVIEVDANPNDDDVINDEVVWSYELGVKGVLLNDRLQYDVSGFLYDYFDFQTSVEENNQLRTIDAGNASAAGLEVLGRFAITRGINVFGNYAYINAEFDETDENGNPQRFAGDTFRLTPEHSFSAGVNAEVSAGPIGTVFVRPNVTWQSEVYFEVPNTETVRGDAYALVDVRAGIRLPGGRFELTGAVENLLDTEYIIDAGNTGNIFGTPTYIAGEPRMLSLTLTARL
jgi:outer membrane receptor protein involved in Fe transport